MPKGYRHLTRDQRCQIAALKSSGFLQKEIANHLNISEAALSRELKRNKAPNHAYDFHYADLQARMRRSKASRKPKRMTPELIAQIEKYIKQQWSPEQISGRLKLKGILISHQSIYQYIRNDRRAHLGTLFKHLRHGGRKYKKRPPGKYKGQIPHRVGIEERPEIVDTRSRLGDWEGDTIIGPRHKGAILSFVERKSKYTVLAKLQRKTAISVVEAAKRKLHQLPKNSVITITLDNGVEFSMHKEFTEKIGAKCYFAKPYCSWERGLNEHTNGLVRQYFTKSRNLVALTEKEIQKVENKLNNRPRKVLGYKTPKEVFDAHTLKVALHT